MLTLFLSLTLADARALDSRRWPVRHAAHQRLHTLGPLALPALAAGVRSPSPEVRERCARLLDRWRHELADLKSRRLLPRRWPRLPWFEGGPTVEAYYLSMARERVLRCGPPQWPEYQEATRLWVRSRLVQRRPLTEVLDALDALAGSERGWILRHGGDFHPRIRLPKGVRP